MTTKIKNLFMRINEALLPLVMGILGYGLVVTGLGIIFAPDRRAFLIGLWTGIGCAVFMAVNIALVLADSVYAGGNVKMLSAKSVMRYLVVVVVFFILAYFKLGDVVAAFIGVMGLKASAYIWQYIFSRRKIRESEMRENPDTGA